MTRKKKQKGPWSAEVGQFPFRVIAEEIPGRPGKLRLRWWSPARRNWKTESLNNVKTGKPIRNSRGEIDDVTAVWAAEAAMRKSQELSGTISAATPLAVSRVTIGDTADLITGKVEKVQGKYPHDSAYRRELVRALEFAATTWGNDTLWEAIDADQWTKLIRARQSSLVRKNLVGRSTETTVRRLMTAIRWLRQVKKISPLAAEPPEDWRDQLKAFRRGILKTPHDAEPYQPRYTIDEIRKILRAGADVDPRGYMLIAIGAEQRLGQVRRATRADLSLTPIEWDAVNALTAEQQFEVDFGELAVRGSGHKRAGRISLSKQQRRVVDWMLAGLLAPLEFNWRTFGHDYPLFPAGRLLGRKHGTPELTKRMHLERPVSREWIQVTFTAIEKKAGVAHVQGRLTYGMKRGSVDAALDEGISERGLMAQGGWTSTKMAHEIYAEKESKAGRREAMRVRSRIRREDEDGLPNASGNAGEPATDSAPEPPGFEAGKSPEADP